MQWNFLLWHLEAGKEKSQSEKFETTTEDASQQCEPEQQRQCGEKQQKMSEETTSAWKVIEKWETFFTFFTYYTFYCICCVGG